MTEQYQEPKKRRFELVFGPAFFAIVLQSILAIITVSYGYGKLSDQSETQKANYEKLVSTVEKNNQDVITRFEQHSRNTADIIAITTQRQTDRTNGINDRLIAVETTIGGIKDSLKVVIDKLDKAANKIN